MWSMVEAGGFRWAMRVAWGLWLLAASWAASAATYTFPGTLPTGCVLSVAGVYACGTLNLGASDTVNITGAAVINFTGGFSIQGSQVNAGGSSANLTLNVGGTFSATAGGKVVGKINANAVSTTGAQTCAGDIAVTAAAGTLSLGTGTSVTGNVSTVNGALGIGGSATITGNVSSVAGDITIGSKSTVTGSVTSTSGLVLLTSGTAGNYTTVGSIATGDGVNVHDYSHVLGATTGSYVSGGTYPWFDGPVTGTSTYISFASHATVNGDLTAASYIYVGLYATIVGNIRANGLQSDLPDYTTVTGNVYGTSYVDLHSHTSVSGTVTANTSYVNFAISSSAGGAVLAKTYVDLGTGGSAGGSVTSQTSYVNGDSLTVGGAISAATTVDVHSNGTFGGSITAGGDISIYNTNTVTGDVTSTGGHVFINDHDTITGNISASSYVSIDDHTVINGNVTSTASNVTISTYSTVSGNVTASTTLTVQSTSSIQQCARSTGSGSVHLYSTSVGGGCCGAVGSCGKSCLHDNVPADCQTLHHVKVTAAVNAGNNCSPSTANVVACQNAACSSNYTWGVSGNFSATGTAMLVTYPSGSAFAIPYGSATTTSGVDFQTTNTGTLTLGATASSPTASSSTTCSLGGSSSCAYTINTSGCSSLHHLAVQHATGTGLTCAPNTVSVVACGDASCSTLYTGGVTGLLTAAGSGITVNFPSGAAFAIASGSSSTTVSVQPVTAGTVTVGATAAAPLASNASTCNFGSPSCAFTVADAGFVMTAPDHVSGTSQSLSIAAVQKSATSNLCVPAFASVTKILSLACSYSNPTSGTRPLLVGGVALNASGSSGAACDGSTQPLSLLFSALGVATASLQYNDVGRVTLNASFLGSGTTAGLNMTGTSSFVVAPSSFALSAITTGPIRAGSAFSATISALNAASAVTPNFGKESSPEGVRLAWTKYLPTGTGASAGTFTGSGVASTLTGFVNGAITASNLSWTEVGTGDLTATLGSGSYLASGLTAVGTTGVTGAVGSFTPHHFNVAVSQACNSAFTYSGQPFSLTLTALNALNGTTLNYNGTATTTPALAHAVTLSAVTNAGLGSFTSGTGSLASSVFAAGVANVSTPVFTFTAKLTAPATIQIRASDLTDGFSSSGGSEGSVILRSGRLRINNAFGSEKSAMTIPVQAQYWTGKAWVLNSLDSNCTAVPVASVALGNYLDAKGTATSGWSTSVTANGSGKAISISGGNATLTLAKPTSGTSAAAVGSVDIGINLGSAVSDASCLSTPRPSTTGAGLSWLRAQFGSTNSCFGVVDYLRDPSSRATFGVYAPELQRAIHAAEVP